MMVHGAWKSANTVLEDWMAELRLVTEVHRVFFLFFPSVVVMHPCSILFKKKKFLDCCVGPFPFPSSLPLTSFRASSVVIPLLPQRTMIMNIYVAYAGFLGQS